MYGRMPTSRIPGYIDKLKEEFESLSQDVNLYKRLSEDYEQRLRSELGERGKIQTTLYELETTHKKIKQQYEDEIQRLRRQIEANGGTAPRSNVPVSLNTSMSVSQDGPSVAAAASALAGVSPPSAHMNVESDKIPSSSSSSMGGGGPGDRGSNDRGGPPSIGGGPSDRDRDRDRGSGGPSAPSSGLPSIMAKPAFSQMDLTTKSSANLIGKRNREPEAQPFFQGRPSLPSMMHSSSSGGGGSPGGAAGSMTPPAKHHKPEPREMDVHRRMSQMSVPPPNGAGGSTSSGGMGAPMSVSGNSSNGGGSGGGGNPLDSLVQQLPLDPKKKDHKRKDDTEDSADGSDWIVGYNPSVQTNLDIELAYNLDHDSVVCCVKFSHDGQYLATGSNKKTQIFDVATGATVKTFQYDQEQQRDFLYIRSVCFHPNGKYLACGDEDKTVTLWDIESQSVMQTFKGHDLDIYSLDFSSDGRYIVSGSGDKKVKVWDVDKGKCLYTLGNDEVGPKDGVTSVAISPDGRLVAAGSLDYIVRLWDAHTGYFLERYEGHTESVHSVAFSPDGKSLASGSLDKTLKLWDLSGSRSRSRCRSTFSGHQDFVLSVAFSPDGNWLISGSKDRTVHFWDPRSAVTHLMLQGHKNSVISVAVSPRDATIATGSGDYRARCWRYNSC